jgi:carbonic anhydrase
MPDYIKESHERVFANNRKWAAKMKDDDPSFFDKLEDGQAPQYLYYSPNQSPPFALNSPCNHPLAITQILI